MKVVISAGGTGGHIYPALAIINKIKEFELLSEIDKKAIRQLISSLSKLSRE